MSLRQTGNTKQHGNLRRDSDNTSSDARDSQPLGIPPSTQELDFMADSDDNVSESDSHDENAVNDNVPDTSGDPTEQDDYDFDEDNQDDDLNYLLQDINDDQPVRTEEDVSENQDESKSDIDITVTQRLSRRQRAANKLQVKLGEKFSTSNSRARSKSATNTNAQNKPSNPSNAPIDNSIPSQYALT